MQSAADSPLAAVRVRAIAHDPARDSFSASVELVDAEAPADGACYALPTLLPCLSCPACERGAAGACLQAHDLSARLRTAAASRQAIVIDDVAKRWLYPTSLPAADAARVAGTPLLAYGMYCRANLSPGTACEVFGQSWLAELLRVMVPARGGVLPGANSNRDVGASEVGSKLFLDLQSLAAAPDETAMLTASLTRAPWLTSVVVCDTGLAESDRRRLVAEVAGMLPPGATLLSLGQPHADLLVDVLAMVAKGELAIDANRQPVIALS